MSTKEDDTLVTALVALGAIGLGIGAFAALSSWEKRRRFNDALRKALERDGVGLIDAALARRSGVPVWVVTVSSPWRGVQVYHAAFEAMDDPYSPQTLGVLIRRLRAALEREARVG